jgi:hypothetical protein
MGGEKDKEQPILLHGEPLGRRLLRTGCLIGLAIIVLLAVLVFGPLRGFFEVMWHGPGPM